MNEYKFVKTEDGSAGLYNFDVNDIYHASSGALKESYEKFIAPSNFLERLKNKSEIRLLDICYGIGYNTKSALNTALEHKYQGNLTVDVLEFDKNLVMFSPFIKDCIRNFDLKLAFVEQLFKNNEISFSDLNNSLNYLKDKYKMYLDTDFEKFHKLFDYVRVNYPEEQLKDLNLHNIYYKYISTSTKNRLKSTKNSIFSIFYHFKDARLAIKELNCTYDIIFLDAFTPLKDPVLWTIEFLSEIKKRMNESSVLVTYSNSTPVRAALMKLGFHLGKNVIGEKSFGTIATFKNDFIEYPLSEFEIGLCEKSMAGIYFRDSDLSLSRNEILKQREIDKAKSNRISTSKYKKQFK